MGYDFAWAIQIADRELAGYFALREASEAGVKVGTSEEALRWKARQDKACAKKRKTTLKGRRVAAMTAANRKKK